MDNELLERFVELMADDLEISAEWLQRWLEIYYRLRRAEEQRELIEELERLSEKVGAIIEEIETDAKQEAPTATPEIRPVSDPEELREAIAREAEVPSPAETFLASVAEEQAPPPVGTEETGEEPAGFEPVKVGAGMRGAAARKFKRDQHMRLDEIRRRGVSLQSIASASGGRLGIKDLLNVLECAEVEFEVYKALAATLDKFENK